MAEQNAIAPIKAAPPDVLTYSNAATRVVSSTELFVSDFTALMPVAEALFKGNFAPSGCKHPSDVAMVLLTGTELGLSHAQSLRMMYMISGKPVLSADAMAAVVKRFCAAKGGGFIRVIENTDERCTVEYQRHDDPEVRSVTWTIDDAKRAGLLSNATWTKYPADMCKARALTRAARIGWPDVMGGVYDPDELFVVQPEPQTARSSVTVNQPPAAPAPAAIEAPAPTAVPGRADGDPITADDLAMIRELAASRGVAGIDLDHLVWFRFDGVTPESLTVEQGRGFYRLLLEKNTSDEQLQQLMSEVNAAVNHYYNQKSAEEENQRAAQVASAK